MVVARIVLFLLVVLVCGLARADTPEPSAEWSNIETVVVTVRYSDGGAVEDGLQVSLSSADGQSMTARTMRGEARFENVVIGPIHIVHDFA